MIIIGHSGLLLCKIELYGRRFYMGWSFFSL